MLSDPVALFRFKDDKRFSLISFWVYFYLFEVRQCCGIHSWYISYILLSKNLCKLLRMLAFPRLPPFSEWRNAG